LKACLYGHLQLSETVLRLHQLLYRFFKPIRIKLGTPVTFRKVDVIIESVFSNFETQEL
jgi:hypothetical protein